MRVNISHPGGILDCLLGDGQLRTDKEGKYMWVIPLLEKEGSSMAVASIKDSRLSVSGAVWNNDDPLQKFCRGDTPLTRGNDGSIIGLNIPYLLQLWC